jgi:hypothetical protein
LFGALALVGVLAVDASAVAATQAKPASSSVRAPNKFKPRKGDYIVNFSGSGSGSMTYSWPANNSTSCAVGQSYTLNYSYHWHWEDVTYGLGGGGAIWSKWTAGGHTVGTTSFTIPTSETCLELYGSDYANYTTGSCSANYLTPNGNDEGLWPEVYTNGASHKRLSVGYLNGGLVDPGSLTNGSCGNGQQHEYDGNAGGFAETGGITANALFSLATAKKGKVLSKTISRSSHAACSSVDTCGPNLEQSDSDGPLDEGPSCGSTDDSDLGIAAPGAVTCAGHDHYSGKLTVQYVKK